MSAAFLSVIKKGYRLVRWARVLTELGGVYFHLFFASVLVSVYVFIRKPLLPFTVLLFFSSRRRHTRSYGDWSSDVCSSDLAGPRRRRARASGRVQARSRGRV